MPRQQFRQGQLVRIYQYGRTRYGGHREKQYWTQAIVSKPTTARIGQWGRPVYNSSDGVEIVEKPNFFNRTNGSLFPQLFGFPRTVINRRTKILSEEEYQATIGAQNAQIDVDYQERRRLAEEARTLGPNYAVSKLRTMFASGASDEEIKEFLQRGGVDRANWQAFANIARREREETCRRERQEQTTQ